MMAMVEGICASWDCFMCSLSFFNADIFLNVFLKSISVWRVVIVASISRRFVISLFEVMRCSGKFCEGIKGS